MNVAQTINQAASVFGSQKALAEALGEKESSLSAFKKGRPISYKKLAQIAAIAGLQDEATRILIEGMAESLSDEIDHEAKAKAGLKAMLAAFPQT
jgi:transcriptional regulator with XRE-family HTH domain